MKRLYFIIALVGTFSACDKANKKDAPSDILFSNLDTTVRPQDDFFEYANGGWIKNNPIPADQSSWGIGNLIREDIYQRLQIINEKAKGEKNATEKIINRFWKTGMDTVQIEKEGLREVAPYLNMINKISSRQSLTNVINQLHNAGIEPAFSESVGIDLKQSDKMALFLSQGGILLPNRDYYFNKDQRTAQVREKYKQYLTQMLKLSSADSASVNREVAGVYQLEENLAAASKTLEQLRDPNANYHKYPVSDLKKLVPAVDWQNWFKDLGIQNIDTVIIEQPEFFKKLNTELLSTDLNIWKAYLKIHVLRVLAPYLSQQFVNTNFAFFSQTLSGAKQMKPRWKRVIDAEQNLMGEMVGRLFVQEYFNETAKKRYADMVEEIRAALRDRITKLDWMSDSTKQKALYKLARMKKKVGYPEKWKDFSAMKINDRSYVSNVLAALKWWTQYYFNKLGKPVDRYEWNMNPQEYNAYYRSPMNEIVLPAGIFIVPGHRDEDLDDALIYGYGGASTIGHEICHGFDDEGRQFDANGNLKNWWSKQDEEKFKQKCQPLINQFNSFIAVDSLHVNGKVSLGENIADLCGVMLGWDAFTKTKQYKEGKMINGLSPAQRFFLGYSLSWLHHSTKEMLQQQTLSDVHAPSKYRVNGPFPNVPAFYEAFNIKPEDKMYLADSLRTKIW